jgi:hypothetical protein
VTHDERLVLVYSGSYASAVELRSILDAHAIRSSFDDIPSNPHGVADARIFVALGDVPRAMSLVAEFRTTRG